jgi:imidazole glycerol-phosphate synthase subunit HisH
MKKKVAIVDYELSNLFSVLQACRYVGLDAIITNEIDEIENADAIILPGVGAYGVAMEKLKKLNLVNTLVDVANSERPLLGICLGMQLLFSGSSEFGHNNGLDIIQGDILGFNSIENKLLKIPQIQWNSIIESNKKSWDKTIFQNIPNYTYMYFVHSYYCMPKAESQILSKTVYGGFEYVSAIQKENVIGVQFHPEKSAKYGLQIYENFANMIN